MNAKAKFLFDQDFAPSAKAEKAVGAAEHALMIAEAEGRGYQAGYAAGQQDTTAAAAQQTAAAFEHVGGTLEHFARGVIAAEQRIEQESIELALAVARKLVPELMLRQPFGEIEALVTECFRQLTSAPHVVVRVNDMLHETATAQLTEIARTRSLAMQQLVATSGIADLAFPIVTHGRPLHGQNVPYLSIDNFGGFRRGAQHLVELGHRRIGLVNGEARQAYAQDRTQGLGAALDEAGIDGAEHLVRYGPLTFTQGYQSTLSILDEFQAPTALLASSILVALGAMKALAERGLRVPQDMSIVAHDDEVAAFPPSMATPQLTTLNSSIRAAGARIAEMALERIASGGKPVPSEVWPVPLTVRGSTAPAVD